MWCVLCRYLIRAEPAWLDEADKLVAELPYYRLNNDTLFEAEANSTRLREIAQLAHSNPAEAILEAGVARGLTTAMTYLAWMELTLSRTEESRSRARSLYERAIAFGDLYAQMSFARAMTLDRFGLRAIPAGIRRLFKAAVEISVQVDARTNARSNA